MTPFFDISEHEELPDDALALVNLGTQRPWITRGRRGSNFWGTSGTPSKTTYRNTTPEDYDQQFVRKIFCWKPVYRIDRVLDHHYNHYLLGGKHDPGEFLMHMRYVVLPILKKKSNSEVCVERFEQWLLDVETPKKEGPKELISDNPKIGTISKTVHRIHFDDLSWSDFERLIFAYVKRLRKWNSIDWLGQSGHDDGQDIWGESEGKTYCYLCANYQSLTNRKAKDDIDKLVKANVLPDNLIVVCGGKVSAGVNKSIKAYAQEKGIAYIEVWSGADIEEDLRLRAPELLLRFFEGQSHPEAANAKGFTAPSSKSSVHSKPTPFRKVFISYAKEDYKYAAELYNYLDHHDYEPWLDKKSLLAGSNWDLEIKNALKKSDFIILLLSSTSVSKRGYVQREYKLALEYWEERMEDDIYIIPVLINECEVPQSLSRFQWLQYDEDAFALIVRSLDIQRGKLIGSTVAVEDHDRDENSGQRSGDAEALIKQNQLKLSKKVHDVVANGLYRIMSELDNRDAIDRKHLLDQLEKVYEHSRNISTEEDFCSELTALINSFADKDCRVAVIGNTPEVWIDAVGQDKYNIRTAIQRLLTVFIQDGPAANIAVRFSREGQQVHLKCEYEGGTQISEMNRNDILPMIDSTKATLTFTKKNKGAAIDITYSFQY